MKMKNNRKSKMPLMLIINQRVTDRLWLLLGIWHLKFPWSLAFEF
jgi:hypothetical protein